MANQSGEFSIPSLGFRPVPQAVAVFNQRLWVIGTDGNNNMVQATLTLERSGQGGTKTIALPDGAKSASNWSNSMLDIPGTPNGQPLTKSPCAATPLGDALYVFWAHAYRSWDYACTLMASRYTVVGESALRWSTALSLQDTTGATLHPSGERVGAGGFVIRSAEVSATPFGSETIIVTSTCVRELGDDAEQKLYIGAFNVNDIDQQSNTWKARSEVWTSFADLNIRAPGHGYPGIAVSIDWVSSSFGPKGNPPYWLWVSLWVAGDGSGSFQLTCFMPLDSAGSPSGGIKVFSLASSDYAAFTVRDPAGRVRTYVDAYNDWKIVIDSYNTFQNGSIDGSTPTYPVDEETLPTISDDGGTPSVAFFTDMNGAKPVNINGQPGTEYPVYEFIVYPASSMKCQVNLLGFAQVLPNYGALTPIPKVSNTFIVSGIVDGPIPVPHANIADVAFQDTQPNFGTVSYSTTDTKSTEHTVSNSWTVGMQTSGEASEGIGVAWDVAISGGAAYTNGTVSTTSIAATRSQESLLDLGTSRPNQKLIPAGTVFCSHAVIQVTVFRFVDPDGHPISDGTDGHAANKAPLFVTTQTTFTDSGPQQYLPYAVTPGDLHSYRPDVLDARMKALGYAGDSYFENIIVPHAYTFKSGQNFLEIAWSADSQVTTSFEATSSAFTEQSWTLDASVYLGVSGGGGFKIFGFGEEESFKILVGGTYSHTANTTDTNTTGWGIAVPSPFGPPSVDPPLAMSGYTFRVYFLPPPAPPSKLPPNFWVQELRDQLKKAPAPPPNLPFRPLNADEIDSNAASWKIAYVVTSYESNDGSQTYNYTKSHAG